jgi:crotonobetainyl-CoA:carnitine CoA-transferase CaiB-like acyl-CoA transferase
MAAWNAAGASVALISGAFASCAQQSAGRMWSASGPMRLSGGPAGWYRSPAPLLGQHNEEVLAGLLGLAADEIADLHQAGVIGERPLGL